MAANVKVVHPDLGIQAVMGSDGKMIWDGKEEFAKAVSRLSKRYEPLHADVVETNAAHQESVANRKPVIHDIALLCKAVCDGTGADHKLVAETMKGLKEDS